MMAQPVPHQSATDKKRVKVYELQNNDWFDRGTGFCTAAFVPVEGGQKEPKVMVESEDQPDRLLLDTRICKEDGFQKQQDTLIVWTEPGNGVDMALSFQEAEGCALIWKFINNVQQSMTSMGGPDDSLSDDLAMDIPSIQLPPPDLGNLADLEANMRMMSATQTGRDALAKAIVKENYITQLISLLEIAEDLETLPELHRLCNIMKTILLINDNGIIEQAVSDECVLGVVGALEYDPDFPSHKANHRQWLNQQGRYKEVVRIEDEKIRRKIHQTYRLQYLKDVVLARILDDNTFGVLNSMIFFNQVAIVQHLDHDATFLKSLFDIFKDPRESALRKKEAVIFIQQCCAIAKNLQPQARANLYHNLLRHQLLDVIHYGLRSPDVSVRVGATDVLVSMIEHDAQMIRMTVYQQIIRKQPLLTDVLIELLLVEVDLGIKSQISDALRILLDSSPPQPQDGAGRGEPDGTPRQQPAVVDPQQELMLVTFYGSSVKKLFRPLIELERGCEKQVNAVNEDIFGYLTEVLCFYMRQHKHRCKSFIVENQIVQRYVYMLDCKEKHLQLIPIRFFKHLAMLRENFYFKIMRDNDVLRPVLDVLVRTLPRDNLVGSACLDLFTEVVRIPRDPTSHDAHLSDHFVEKYRERLLELTDYKPFADMIKHYEQSQFSMAETYTVESEDERVRRSNIVGSRSHMEHLAMDPAQEEYWNTSDDEDDHSSVKDMEVVPGSTPSGKPLVDYASDEEDEVNDKVESSARHAETENSAEAAPATGSPASNTAAPVTTTPPERISEKRRREQDEDDELDKLVLHKRRNSSASAKSVSSFGSASDGPKKKGLGGSPASRDQTQKKTISIIMGSSLKTAAVGQDPASQDENTPT
ncbi:Platinum sensitivity protein [Coniochaeta pulveracea]|uniref:Platinum sensitivity protein n=2 Tax=Coniochaeta pulveracea TaxID=177199 RepID=A0A420YD90_9PEZI|nr:Platinum sensitivity protein [Coniochaeta pulveracea]